MNQSVLATLCHCQVCKQYIATHSQHDYIGKSHWQVMDESAGSWTKQAEQAKPFDPKQDKAAFPHKDAMGYGSLPAMHSFDQKCDALYHIGNAIDRLGEVLQRQLIVATAHATETCATATNIRAESSTGSVIGDGQPALSLVSEKELRNELYRRTGEVVPQQAPAGMMDVATKTCFSMAPVTEKEAVDALHVYRHDPLMNDWAAMRNALVSFARGRGLL